MSLIDIDWNPSPTKLRQFALIWFSGFGVVALVLAWKWGCFSGSRQWEIPVLILLVAASVGLMGLLFPPAVRPVYKLWMGLAFPIGWILSHAVLAIIYFGIFTLVGLVFRVIGRDPLDRLGHRQRESYWVNCSDKHSTKRYFQQF